MNRDAPEFAPSSVVDTIPAPIEAIPLDDPPESPAELRADGRPRMAEPLPVRLLTVNDARLIAAAGLERNLDEFYIDLLGFEREPHLENITYHAENFRLTFEVAEPPIAVQDMRPLGIEVLSLREAEQKLIDAEIDYARQRGLTPGQESILLQDPAGNWIELTASSTLR